LSSDQGTQEQEQNMTAEPIPPEQDPTDARIEQSMSIPASGRAGDHVAGPDFERLLSGAPAHLRASLREAYLQGVEDQRARGARPVDIKDAHHRATPETRAEIEHALAEKRAEDWRAKAGAMFADARLDTLDTDQHPAELRAWFEDGHRNLVLRGEKVGTGKTYCAYSLGNAAVAAGEWASIWVLADLLAALRQGTEHDPKAWRAVTQCNLLVIDDLGKEHLPEYSGWPQEQFFRLLDHRGRAHDPSKPGGARRTIVTTNLDGQAFSARYGAPVVSRLIDDARVLEFTGKMRRAPAPW
jgi:DNA replication protein DnaC